MAWYKLSFVFHSRMPSIPDEVNSNPNNGSLYAAESDGPSPPGIIYTVRTPLYANDYHANIIPIQQNLSQLFRIFPTMSTNVNNTPVTSDVLLSNIFQHHIYRQKRRQEGEH